MKRRDAVVNRADPHGLESSAAQPRLRRSTRNAGGATTEMLDECRRECALVTVDLDERSRWPRLIKHVGGKAAASESTLLVAFRGSRIGGEMRRPREDAIRVLAALYEAAASVDPKWEVVPLFEFCGWTRESIAERYVVSTTYAVSSAISPKPSKRGIV